MTYEQAFLLADKATNWAAQAHHEWFWRGIPDNGYGLLGAILRALSPQRHHLVSRIVQQPLRQRNNIFHTEPPFSRRLALKKFVQRLGGRGNAGIARQRKPDAHIRKRVACLILNQKAAPPRPCCARDGL